jgi:hypothetical protein
VGQPIRREKAVLSTRIEIADGAKDEEVTSILARIETAVKEIG